MRAYRLYSDLPTMSLRKVTANIDTDALAYNYKKLCGVTEGARHICVVKSDAYGHGADACVRRLLAEGCDFFAVSCIEEAIAVRKTCRDAKEKDPSLPYADILILGYTYPSQAKFLAEHDIIQALLSHKFALELDREAQKAGVAVRSHVALDTGMNRIGFPACSDDDINSSAKDLLLTYSLPSLSVEGIFTHFAKADEEYGKTVADDSHTNRQFGRYQRLVSILKDAGTDVGIRHVCNSAASVRFEDFKLDAVRFGIMLYGAAPSEHIDFGLRPVMKLDTVVSHIHTLLPHESVSYGGKFSSNTPRKIATLPIGYADGFLRAYSGAEVSVYHEGQKFKARIVGRICMDQCMIDVTDLPAVCVGDKVRLFGDDTDELAALAKMADTIEYESLCLISSRAVRVYNQT